jgi:hypothetical protein
LRGGVARGGRLMLRATLRGGLLLLELVRGCGLPRPDQQRAADRGAAGTCSSRTVTTLRPKAICSRTDAPCALRRGHDSSRARDRSRDGPGQAAGRLRLRGGGTASRGTAFRWSAAMIERGEDRYGIYCRPCHDGTAPDRAR